MINESRASGIATELSKQFIIPVVRETDAGALERLAMALADGGLKILEITLMSDGAYQVIENLTKRGLTIGAGTVLNVYQAKGAIDAGAKFLVSPGLNADVVKTAQSVKTPIYPGVLTPTEIMQAAALGCEELKIFPISAVGGVSYLNSLKGPFPSMKWMPSGGVSLENFRDFKKAGCVCVGMGGKLVAPEMIAAKNWSGLKQIAEAHVRAVAQA